MAEKFMQIRGNFQIDKMGKMDLHNRFPLGSSPVLLKYSCTLKPHLMALKAFGFKRLVGTFQITQTCSECHNFLTLCSFVRYYTYIMLNYAKSLLMANGICKFWNSGHLK